jgi:hypothetical protein
MNVLAGTDFFTVEVLTRQELATYYVLFFLHLESRRVTVAGITRHPNQEWMEQIARSATQESWFTLFRRLAIKQPTVPHLGKLADLNLRKALASLRQLG